MSDDKYKIDEAEAARLKEKVEVLRGGIADRAHHLVHVVMPQRVVALSELFNKTPDISIELEQVHSTFEFSPNFESDATGQGDSKKRKTTDGEAVDTEKATIPSNKVILDLIAVVKKNILQLIEAINCVKLNIPKIEDGNNFGVSIQEETVGELGRAEDSGYALLENLSKYFLARAKLVTKVIKYPQIQDYRKSVQELDEKEYVNLKLSCLDLRNNYAILFDMITKNMDKIRAPRPSSHLNSMF